MKGVEKIKTHILCSITFFRISCRLWDNVKKYIRAREATDDIIIRRMRFARWITKATNTHSEYVTLIAFPRQQWFRERVWILRYTYIACLVGRNASDTTVVMSLTSYVLFVSSWLREDDVDFKVGETWWSHFSSPLVKTTKLKVYIAS
jgi:hypothetical protein